MYLNEERPGSFVWFLTSQCRRFGRESVSYSETNWQESFDLIGDSANRAPGNRALVSRPLSWRAILRRVSQRGPRRDLDCNLFMSACGAFTRLLLLYVTYILLHVLVSLQMKSPRSPKFRKLLPTDEEMMERELDRYIEDKFRLECELLFPCARAIFVAANALNERIIDYRG